MAKTFYPTFLRDLQRGLYDVLSGAYAYRVYLMKSGSYNAAHELISDIGRGANELSVGGYTAQDIGTRVLTASGSGYQFGGANATWAALAAGQDIVAAVMARYTAADADNQIELVSWDDGGTSPNELPWPTDGGAFTYDISGGIWIVQGA